MQESPPTPAPLPPPALSTPPAAPDAYAHADAPAPPEKAEPVHLLGQDLEALALLLRQLGQPPYRARQIMQWVYDRAVCDFANMSDLPLPLRTELAARISLLTSSLQNRSVAAEGTFKLLLAWPDGATTETVMIPSEELEAASEAARGPGAGRGQGPVGPQRRTVCLSTQVGCNVGCRFCATGLDKAERNLTAGQIVEQVLRVEMVLREGLGAVAGRAVGRQVTNIVFMGMGEPLANYAAVVRSIRLLNAPWSLNLGARRITVSTVGLPKQIRQLAREGLQITLALSLHAPTDDLRAELIPWARGIRIDDLLSACREYFEQTGREVTFEYCLLDGVNDGLDHARELARLARRIRANVNVMMYNPVAGLPFARPSRNRAVSFLKALRDQNVNAHLRHSRGLEADAACGQLRRKTLVPLVAAPTSTQKA